MAVLFTFKGELCAYSEPATAVGPGGPRRATEIPRTTAAIQATRGADMDPMPTRDTHAAFRTPMELLSTGGGRNCSSAHIHEVQVVGIFIYSTT
jgi:hypothetical protein